MTGDRDYLMGLEVERLIAAVKSSRNETRDRCVLLLRPFGNR
jgi:hypothetical protein